MELLLLLSSLLCLGFIFLQDVKDRSVSLLLFIINFIALGLLHYLKGNRQLLIGHIAINFCILTPIILVLYAYVKIVLKTSLEESIGLGDLFWTLALAFGFPTLSFMVLLAFSFLFSLGLHLVYKSRYTNPLVPLAGYQSLFLLLLLVTNELFPGLSLYAI